MDRQEYMSKQRYTNKLPALFTQRDVILASKSPRRLEILADHGIFPEVFPADIREDDPVTGDIGDLVMHLALKKGLWVEQRMLEQNRPGCLIISSDTVVYKDRVMGKPADPSEAAEMIRSLRDDTHQVYSSAALIVAGESRRRVSFQITNVTFGPVPDEVISSYVATDEPYDKAGGYAVQMTMGKYITNVDGDLENVIGLPYELLISEAEKMTSLDMRR